MESPSERLDRAMDARRLDLDLNWNDLAIAAKIAPATLRAIRRGTSQPSALTRRRLEDALRWQHGSVKAVMNGSNPTPVDRRSTLEVQRDVIDQVESMAAERERLERFERICNDPERVIMLDKFMESIDPGDPQAD